MKKEEGLGVTLMIIIVCIIIMLVGWGIYMYIEFKNNIRENSIKSDMLLIQGACKVCYETNVMNKTTDELIGTKVSEVEKNEEISKIIIDDFLKLNIIKEDDYDNYYILTNKDLEALKLEVTNHEGSYYIVGYEKEDVIFTLGYEGKHRLSELNNEQTTEEENNTSDQDKEESDSEEKDESEESDSEDKDESEETDSE